MTVRCDAGVEAVAARLFAGIWMVTVVHSCGVEEGWTWECGMLEDQFKMVEVRL